ncbi:MAG: TIGR00730 family Rossman fold protein [Eubacteriales bacterium]|jgi:uncharacterized protein (TIGR00730 family)
MNIAVYLGSRPGNDPSFNEEAAKLGSWIARNDHVLVYGGSRVGTMGVLAQTVLSLGGKVIGVMPVFMMKNHLGAEHLTKMILTKDMSSRRVEMMKQANVWLAMPGGPGTLDEITEVISDERLGLIHGHVVIYNKDGYYDDLRNQLRKMIEMGFYSEEELAHVRFIDSLDELDSL